MHRELTSLSLSLSQTRPSQVLSSFPFQLTAGKKSFLIKVAASSSADNNESLKEFSAPIGTWQLRKSAKTTICRLSFSFFSLFLFLFIFTSTKSSPRRLLIFTSLIDTISGIERERERKRSLFRVFRWLYCGVSGRRLASCQNKAQTQTRTRTRTRTQISSAPKRWQV